METDEEGQMPSKQGKIS